MTSSADLTLWGIVVAAGSGSRFGGDKHVAELGGRPLWQWARDALIDAGASGVVVVGAVEGGIVGGDRRQDSVANGLGAVPESDLIAVHDAARPLASPDLIRRMLSALDDASIDGVVPGVPVRDTIKAVDGAVVGSTVDRSTLIAVQTPQVFRSQILRKAHAEVSADATDDAAMVEQIGGAVAWVHGEARALKITCPEDMVLARHHLEHPS